MKKVICLFAFLLAIVTAAFCDNVKQEGIETEPFDYETIEPIKVYKYNFTNEESTSGTALTANSGLRFIRIGDIKTDKRTNGLGQVYVIQFLKITDEPNEMTANNAIINKNNSDYTHYYCILAADFKEPKPIIKRYKTWSRNNKWNVGALSLPAKFRPSIGDTAYNFTYDFNLGASIGWSFRATHYKPNYLTIVGVIGKTSVELDSTTTKGYITQPNIKMPAWTFAFGIIGEFSNFQVGFIMGGDFVGGIAGQKWLYDERAWYSIGLGYQFLNRRQEQ